ncbi:MAG: hypothetical protein HY259_14775 [Chloroflexi bacterium]|nr:hypothetical protein [Chloroflexota bacterium]MBI3734700.1 hypothetical protein [Chloroflexota bacterium]
MQKWRTMMEARPRLWSWILLAAGMVILLLIASKDVPLEFSQRSALVIATIVLAGLCVWIIDLE